MELKCLVFLGIALLLALFVAFYMVQGVAKRLVMETTRQSAHDFASSAVLWSHQQVGNRALPSRSPEVNREMLQTLEPFVLRSDYKYTILQLDENIEYEDLQGLVSETPFEQELILRLASKHAALRETSKSDSSSAVAEAPDNKKNSDSKPSNYQIGLPNQRDWVYEEAGPIEDLYYYYEPVPFIDDCMICHVAKPISSSGFLPQQSGAFPFRVVRVELPYSSTRTSTIGSFAIMSAIALATLGFSLFSVHLILKRLVIRPLIHLRDVSDEISRGRSDLRAVIDTDDEFHELGQAFNRMVLHMTDTETELRKVNHELDRRVDQLAQANLQLYEANRLKNDFLANMSHELRTPLNSILGFSEVLQGIESLTDKQKRYASNIQKSGRLLLEMINDILDLAKVEAGKMEVRPTHFDLVHVIKGQCDVIRNLSEDKNIDVQIDCELAELVIYQDQTKIQQILTNLLSNAIKFTPEGGLITISIQPLDTDQVVFTVADTGVGIAEDEFEIIFQKFRQSKSIASGDGVTREYSGTGLGLSIVRELCRLLKGDVRLSSTLGQGSSFEVVLPIHYVSSSTAIVTGNKPAMY